MSTQEVILVVDELVIDEAPVTSTLASGSVSKQKKEPTVPKPTQEEIDAEALAIAKRLMQRHAKTWTELAKY